MKLNLGCGRKLFHGYVNIDIASYDGIKPDIVTDLRKIPLKDNCADEVLAVHVFEHFYRWEVDDVIQEWHRLLRHGGKLILELPDVVKCAQNVLDIDGGKTLVDYPRMRDIDQPSLWGLYGDPREQTPYMSHKWGWSPKTLTAFLEGHHFVNVSVLDTEFHAVGRKLRDMRIEANKA